MHVRKAIVTKKHIIENEIWYTAQFPLQYSPWHSWYENEYDIADSFTAQERAQEAEAARMVREQIQTEVLITEVDKAVHQRYTEGINPSNTYAVGRG